MSSIIALLYGADRPGIVARVSTWIHERGGNVLHADQHLDRQENVFFQRVEWECALGTNSIQEGEDFQKMANAENASLPRNNNGGIWIQPLNLPKQPRLKNVIDIGTLICTKKKYEELNSNCKLNAGNLPQKTFRIYSLFSKGLVDPILQLK